MKTLSIINVFHISPVSLGRPHPCNLQCFPYCRLTKYHRVWNQIMIMKNCQVALVNIWAVPSVLLRVHYRLLEGVIIFSPEVTNNLAHVCIGVVE